MAEQYELLVLMGQRIQDYPGQYAPEAIEVIDSFANDDNPDFLIEARSERDSTGEFEGLAVVTLLVDRAALEAILNPSKRPIQAEVKTNEE